MNKVLYIQTTLGFNMISEVSKEKSTDEILVLVNPLQHSVSAHPQQPGAMRESFGEILVHAKSTEDIPLQSRHVFLAYEPEKRLTDNYTKAISNIRAQKSGILMPNPPQVKGGLVL